MDKEFTASNFIPERLLDIICILESDEKHHVYKIVQNKKTFSLIAKFGTKNEETTPLKDNASAQKTAHLISGQETCFFRRQAVQTKAKAWKENFFNTCFRSRVCKSTFGQEPRFFQCRTCRTTEVKEEENTSASGKGQC